MNNYSMFDDVIYVDGTEIERIDQIRNIIDEIPVNKNRKQNKLYSSILHKYIWCYMVVDHNLNMQLADIHRIVKENSLIEWCPETDNYIYPYDFEIMADNIKSIESHPAIYEHSYLNQETNKREYFPEYLIGVFEKISPVVRAKKMIENIRKHKNDSIEQKQNADRKGLIYECEIINVKPIPQGTPQINYNTRTVYNSKELIEYRNLCWDQMPEPTCSIFNSDSYRIAIIYNMKSKPNIKPDLDKLARATNDILTQHSVIFDDSQITELHCKKIHDPSLEDWKIAIKVFRE